VSDPKFKLKPVVTYKMRGVAESHSATALYTRDLMDVSDEPLERGGTNEGFAPTEFVLAGLVACTNVISHKIARANEISIESMDINVEAQFNRMGVTLGEHVKVPFPEIKLIINVVSDATEAQQQTLKTDLAKYCAVSNIIRQSGTKINEQWTFTTM
jgi:uncharacterized OsmC-like protein